MRDRRAWGEVVLGLSCLLLAIEGGPRLIARAAADAAPPSTPPPADFAPETSGPPRPAGAPRVASYALRARLDETAHAVSATGTIVWTNPSTVPARELYL